MKCADPIRADIERARRQLERGADPARVLGELSRRLTNKLLHAPLRALNPTAARPRAPSCGASTTSVPQRELA